MMMMRVVVDIRVLLCYPDILQNDSVAGGQLSCFDARERHDRGKLT